MMKAISQPIDFAIKGMVSGAAKAPTVAPALKILVDKALSFLGKYSAVALIAAGKFPASPTANTKRAKMNSVTLVLITSETSLILLIISLDSSKPTNQFPVIIPEVAIPQKACKTAPIDQMKIAHRNPFLVSIQSTNFPAKSMLPA
ncbi:hypothetical protein D3C80_1246490 [compost metagenome]